MELLSKTALMQPIINGTAHESFEHSEEGWFDITLMREWAKANLKPELVEVAAIIPFIKTTRVFDPQRVDDLGEEAALDDPALVVVYEKDGQHTHLYIDGTHRALKLEKMGEKYQLAYFIPEANIIRPDLTKMGHAKDLLGIDWGDEMVDGKIIKRT